MKVVIGCLLSAFLAGFYCTSYAQSPSATIRGKVLFQDRSPAVAATIILLKKSDSSMVKSVIAEKTGLFSLTGLPPDKYLLLVTIIGYTKSYYGPYLVNRGQTVNIPDITLSLSPKQLKTVTVFSTRPEIDVTPGKTTLHVQNSLLDEGNSVFDILRGSPGVRADNNNISLVGHQRALIMIDGKPTNLSGADLIEVLKGMQSNTIDRIELITGGSAKYDASAGGIINIISRKGKNTGINGSVNGTAGYGKYYKSNAGIVFNDGTPKFNIFGNYNYSNNKTFHDFTNDRNINFNNVVSGYNTNYNSVQKRNENAFSAGADYYLSRGQTVGFLVSGFITDANIIKNNNLKIYNQSLLDSTITANSGLNRHTSQVNYNLNYNGKLDKAGKTLSGDFNYTTYNRSSAEYITNGFFDASGNTYRNPLLLQNLSPSTIHIWQAIVGFTDPLSKTSKLEAGLKYSKVVSNNYLILDSLVSGVYKSYPMFTNHFIYTENVNAAYVNYENKLDKFDLTAGLRVEQTIATGNSVTSGQVVNSNYTGLFPHVLLTYRYDDKHDLSLNYNRGITRPNYERLNPFLYYVDRYDYTAGNPNLKPQYTNSLELSYNYFRTFVTTLYSTITSNAYEFPFYEQNDASKVNINTRVNLGTVYTYGARFFAPVVFTNWWNADFDVNASYQRYVAYRVNGNLNKGAQDIILTTNQHFIISPTISAEIFTGYESPNFYGVNEFKAEYHIDAVISKQLFNKRGSLKLGVTDIFNTWHDRTYTNYQNLNMTGTDKVETQVARLTFTYRFGKIGEKNTPHTTGNEEEQNRTKPVN
jgi:iron complex outermembrane receptor protein